MYVCRHSYCTPLLTKLLQANNAKTLGEWGDIGTAAWVVLNKCTFTPQKPLMATGTGKIAGGYVNYLQNWGAIVGRARC